MLYRGTVSPDWLITTRRDMWDHDGKIDQMRRVRQGNICTLRTLRDGSHVTGCHMGQEETDTMCDLTWSSCIFLFLILHIVVLKEVFLNTQYILLYLLHSCTSAYDEHLCLTWSFIQKSWYLLRVSYKCDIITYGWWARIRDWSVRFEAEWLVVFNTGPTLVFQETVHS